MLELLVLGYGTLEWLVNCFLKALEGIPYSRRLQSAKLYRNDVQVIIRHVTIS